MLYLTTYFDKNYLSRGLVLYESLKEHGDQFELYVLCLDEYTMSYFLKNSESYPEIKTISLTDIEKSDPELYASKQNRTKIEYYFTLSPCLPLYLLKKFKLAHICSLDADIMFLSSPKSLFDYLDAYSIIVTPHKFAPHLKYLENRGLYNVSFQIFKNDDIGIACLEKWREQCIEWCGDYPDEENNRYADQKYLDSWDSSYPNKVKALNDSVSGLALWNLNNYHLTYSNRKFYSNNERLIFYHFHDFKLLGKDWASNGFAEYKVEKSTIIDRLYLNYWNQLDNKNNNLGLLEDVSERVDLSKTVSVKLSKINHVYFKLLNIRVFHVNYAKLSSTIKKIIYKIYG